MLTSTATVVDLLPAARQNPARIPLSSQRKEQRRMPRQYAASSTVLAWSPFFVWGAFLWGCDLTNVTTPQVRVTSGVMEGLRPPLSRRTSVWTELHAPPEERHKWEDTTPREFKPRTWPQNYEDIPYKMHRNTNTSTRPTKVMELRHLPSFRDDCEPMAAWHTYSFPTCNSMHELDLETGLVSAPDLEAEGIDTRGELHIEYMSNGGTRESWLVDTVCADGDADCSIGNRGPNVVLKTLRWPVVHDEVVYNHQRIDALASERLTSSPHVMNIYGFCGVSALNEFADGGNFRKMFLQNHYNMTDTERLAYARDAALGLADVHEIDGPNNKASLVHHDFSAKNLFMVNGKLKVSDFNDGQLSRWNTKTKTRCFGFNWDGLCGTNTERTNRRAPEECRGDRHRRRTSEKVEVYHLGVLFFVLLSGEEWPYYLEQRSKDVRYKTSSSKVKDLILAGKQPTLPLGIEQSSSPIIQGILHATRKAFAFNPEMRPSARKIANFLVDMSNTMEGEAQL